MASNLHLKIPGVDGESKDKGHDKWIEIQSVSWGASNPTSLGGGGLGAGKVNFSDVSIMKMTDSASAKLHLACAQGEHFDSAELNFTKSGGKEPVVYLVIKLEEVFVSSFQGSSSDGTSGVSESISFAFKKITYEYKGQDGKGKGSGAGEYVFDLAKNANE